MKVNQIDLLVRFILTEAEEKADEICVKAEKEFRSEKLRLVNEAKARLRKEYDTKKRDVIIQTKIARSKKITADRLRLQKLRNGVIDKLIDETANELSTVASHEKYPDFLCSLIVEGLVKLREPKVTVRVRKCDLEVAKDIMPKALEQYHTFMANIFGKDIFVTKLKLDSHYLAGPPDANNPGAFSCLGGAVLITKKKKIVLDNTLDARMKIAREQLAPFFRKAVFPELDHPNLMRQMQEYVEYLKVAED